MVNKNNVKETKLPYITINAAMSADGKIDTIERIGAKISSAEDWGRVDRLRADHDAIMIGGKTLLSEDPRLTVKSSALKADRLTRGLDADPVKVGIVSQAVLPENSRFINHGSGRVVIFTTNRTSREQIEHLRGQGVEVYTTAGDRVNLLTALEKLRKIGISSILVEGGGTLNSALIQLGLVDKIHIYIAPVIFGGSGAPTLADGIGLSQKNAIRLEILSTELLGDGGIILRYGVKK